MRHYEDSLKYYRDLKNSLDTARDEGVIERRKEGSREEKLSIAKNALAMGLSIPEVMQITGLSQAALESLK